MKTLIITGTAQQAPDNKVKYILTLFGQTQEHPLCVYIISLDITVNGYTAMQEVCREKYAKYFETDLFNIISLENINMI